MPFGLRNAGNTFQRMMDRILSGLDFCFWYLDDIIVASSSSKQHLAHLHLLFQRLREHGLVINLEKCVFSASSVEFLGHEISASSARPLRSHVQANEDFPRPGTFKQLQAFLGLVNFYRRLVPQAACILTPLTDILCGGHTGNKPVQWSPTLQMAFEEAKQAVAAASVLARPVLGSHLSLAVDASATHVGAALQQQVAGSAAWQPLGFFSRKLEPAQVRYSAFDRELLTCYLGIRHFRFLLEGRLFTIYTDHKPLTYALARATDPWTARQCRQLSYIAEFTHDIRHIKGADNIVADTLSRPAEIMPAGEAASVKAPPCR
jgi:hypothetical protein